MKIKRYLEHQLTNYFNIHSKVNNLFSEANIKCVKQFGSYEEPLSFHYDRAEKQIYLVTESKNNSGFRFLHPYIKSSLFNKYEFDSCNFSIGNEYAIEEANKLFQDYYNNLSDYKKRIRFYPHDDANSSKYSIIIEPDLHNDIIKIYDRTLIRNFHKFNLKTNDSKLHLLNPENIFIVFDIKEHTFYIEGIKDITSYLEYIKKILDLDIPDELIPSSIMSLYQSRVVSVKELSDKDIKIDIKENLEKEYKTLMKK